MVPVARRNLLAEKFRLAIAVGGVAFAVFLIVIVLSLYQGFRSNAGEFARDFPAVRLVILSMHTNEEYVWQIKTYVKDENGIITKRNFMPLGTIEDVYGNKTFRQWHKRCEQYCRSRGYKMAYKPGGAGNSDADSSAKTGVAGITLDKWSRLEVHQPPRTD